MPRALIRLIPVGALTFSLGVDLVPQEGAAIIGRVFDTSGQPLAGARVTALRRLSAPVPTERLTPAGQNAQTNDRGEFRIDGLPTGEYYISAAPPPGSPLNAPVSGAKAMVPTLFPGTVDPSAARPIAVAAGQTIDGIVVRLVSVPGFEITGMVVDDGGNPIAGAMLILTRSPRADVVTPGPIAQARSDGAGRFVIGNVPNGLYTLIATVPVLLNDLGANHETLTMPMPTQLDITVEHADVRDLRAVVHAHQH